MFVDIVEIVRNKDRYLGELICNIEKMIYIDPYTVILKGRTIGEKVVKNIIEEEEINEECNLNQKERIMLLQNQAILDEEIAKAFNIVRIYGNKAIHDEIEAVLEGALVVRRNLYKILYWYVLVYCDDDFYRKEYAKYVEYIEPDFIGKIAKLEKDKIYMLDRTIEKLWCNG